MTKQNLAAVRVVVKVLSPIEPARMRRQVGRLVCSSAWLERCLTYLTEAPVKLKRVDHVLARSEIYPPGGAGRGGTRMKRCAGCGVRWYPPQYVKGCGLCEDCVAAMEAPIASAGRSDDRALSSPTGEAMRQLERLQVRLVECRLAAEDEHSLRRMIAEYLAGNPEGSSGSSKNTKKHI
jgi:hypothetical protein